LLSRSGLAPIARIFPAMEPPMNARYMPTKAAASYTGLSISTLNKLRVIGDGPKYVKCGRRVVYEIADLDDWLASLKRHSTSDSPLVAGLDPTVERGGSRS